MKGKSSLEKGIEYLLEDIVGRNAVEEIHRGLQLEHVNAATHDSRDSLHESNLYYSRSIYDFRLTQASQAQLSLEFYAEVLMDLDTKKRESLRLSVLAFK